MGETIETIPKVKKENHKQRAYLNSITSVLDYAGMQITGFIVSPFIVGGLGSNLYGIYQVLNQMTGYANMADTRASQVLKWTVAQKRDIATKKELRSELTTALVVTSIILPLVMIIGGVLVWFSPIITQAEEEYYELVRITCSLMILSLIIYKAFDIFESLLRGMNLGFKGMGIRTGIIVVGGGLKVLAITQGYGLIGLSVVQVFIGLATGIIFYLIVKKNVEWFGFGSTNKQKVISYSKLSGWFMAFSFSNMLLLSSDKIVLGYLLGPESVTVYVLTIFAIKAMEGIINAVVSGIIPGIGKFFGNNDYEKVKEARKVIRSIMWICVATFGVSIIVFNQSFLFLWMGEGVYAGNLENLFILFISIQYMFFNLDSTFINVTLDIKTKVIFSTLSSALTILLAFYLVEEYGILGLCLSLLFGRAILSFGYPVILKKKLKERFVIFQSYDLQPVLVIAIIFSIAYYFSDLVFIENWINLIAFGAVAFVLTGFLMWGAGLSSSSKNAVLGSVSKVKFLSKLTG